MKRIKINTGKEYEVIVGSKIMESCAELITKAVKGRNTCVVTDSTVSKLYLEIVVSSLEKAGFTVSTFVFKAGEASKTLDTASQIYDVLIENQITRSDFLVALGGGVVGDVTGFVASTYLRGIEVVQIPTTFLAAIDSSVGGKTGVNIPAGKNLVGAFHQPSLVICDTDSFKSLSEDEFANGVAEAIKYGIIKDKELFETLENENIHDNIEAIVCRCVEIKKDVVQNDELDLGERMMLNFGHTFAHSIEKRTNHLIPHGKAVAMGMVIIEKLGGRMGITPDYVLKRTISCLEKYNLPTDYDEDIAILSKDCLSDKKRSGDYINIILAEDIGKCEIKKMPIADFLSPIPNKKGNTTAYVYGKLCGTIVAPASKSDLHRLIICASLAKGTTEIDGYTSSMDISATIGIMASLGAKILVEDGKIYVTGIETPSAKITANCVESGSTLRFLLPLMSALGVHAHITGSGKLPQRPLEPLKGQMEKQGAKFLGDHLPLEIMGELKSGSFELPGDVSSQYISGLLFALPLLNGWSEIVLTSPLQSKAYVDMTLQTLKIFGIEILIEANRYIIKGNQRYVSPKTIKAEGDWSNAAFWIVGGALGEGITIKNLNKDSLQADKAVCNVLRRMGAKIKMQNGDVIVSKSELLATDIDAGQIPDIIPVLAVAASKATGTTKIFNAERLRLKECDRLMATVKMLQGFGVKASETKDGMIITGKDSFEPAQVDSFNDHRMAMSGAIASSAFGVKANILQPLCVKKSYPMFYEHFKYLGGHVDVINVGK